MGINVLSWILASLRLVVLALDILPNEFSAGKSPKWMLTDAASVKREQFSSCSLLHFRFHLSHPPLLPLASLIFNCVHDVVERKTWLMLENAHRARGPAAPPPPPSLLAFCVRVCCLCLSVSLGDSPDACVCVCVCVRVCWRKQIYFCLAAYPFSALLQVTTVPLQGVRSNWCVFLKSVCAPPVWKREARLGGWGCGRQGMQRECVFQGGLLCEDINLVFITLIHTLTSITQNSDHTFFI